MSDYKNKMQNEQDDNLNFIAIPNVFFDYWMRVTNEEEFKILNWFVRKTYAFTIEFDFCLEDLVNEVGMSEKKVRKNLQSVSDKDMIIKIASDFHRHRDAFIKD